MSVEREFFPRRRLFSFCVFCILTDLPHDIPVFLIILRAVNVNIKCIYLHRTTRWCHVSDFVGTVAAQFLDILSVDYLSESEQNLQIHQYSLH